MRIGWWLDLVIFVAILAIGTARLPTPLGGDQALNSLIGHMIASGGAPYRDLWDLKHPGIFFFFGAGGALFGFTEIGIHLFELVWMMCLAVLVRIAAGRWLKDWVSVTLAPALTAGVYFAVAGERYLTQTESLVGLPLFVSLWCSVEAAKSNRPAAWLLASSLAGGVALVFKIPYIALPVLFWAVSIRQLALQRPESAWRTAARMGPWLLAGALLPLAATLAYLAYKGSLAVFLWTILRHPAEAAAAGTLDPRRLVRASRSIAILFAPLLPLAAIGAWRSLRGTDTVGLALCEWGLLGSALIAMQVISWWDYQFFLLLVPLGLLAARGLEAVQNALGEWMPAYPRLARMVVSVGLVLLFAPQLAQAARVTSAVWQSRPLPFSEQGLLAYQAWHFPGYAAIRQDTAFLRDSGRQPGPIYVIDTPVYYVHANRWPAVPLLAPWFHPTDRLWKCLLERLNDARPPYIRVSEWALESIVGYRPSLRTEVGEIGSLLEKRYVAFRRDESGTWYIRRDLAGRTSR